MRIRHQWNAPSSAIALSLTLMSGLAACAPLAQAPLVYTSKMSIGADVSTTSTESPGLSLNVGYKSVDAAYVPVVVGVNCDTGKPPAACTQPKYQFQQIRGVYTTDDRNSPSDKKWESAKADLKQSEIDLQAALNALELAEDTAKANKDLADQVTTRDEIMKKAESDLAQADKALDRAKSPPAGSAADADQVEKAQATRDAAQKALDEAKKALNVAQQASDQSTIDATNIQTARNRVNDAQNKRDAAAKAKAQAEAERAQTATIRQEDAYSVFGSFSGDTSANGGDGKAVGSLSVGRVFSTGVASQFLTQGLKQATAAQCLDRATVAAADVRKSLSDASTPEEKAAASALITMIFASCKGNDEIAKLK